MAFRVASSPVVRRANISLFSLPAYLTTKSPSSKFLPNSRPPLLNLNGKNFSFINFSLFKRKSLCLNLYRVVIAEALVTFHYKCPGPKYSIRAISGTTAAPDKDIKEEKSPENWNIKMLYDGECPLCMREVYTTF